MTKQRKTLSLPKGWGVDIFTGSALDLLRIMLRFGNLTHEQITAMILGHRGQGKINLLTVENFIDNLREATL